MLSDQCDLNILDIFNFVIDFFSERFIGLRNIIDLVLIKKISRFLLSLLETREAHTTTDNHCANLQRRRVDNYVMIILFSVFCYWDLTIDLPLIAIFIYAIIFFLYLLLYLHLFSDLKSTAVFVDCVSNNKVGESKA